MQFSQGGLGRPSSSSGPKSAVIGIAVCIVIDPVKGGRICCVLWFSSPNTLELNVATLRRTKLVWYLAR